MDFSSNQWQEAYNSLFTDLEAKQVHFHMDQYDNEFVIYGVALPGKVGTCDIEMEFSKAPEENLVVLFFCFYDSTFTVDSKGQFTDGKK